MNTFFLNLDANGWVMIIGAVFLGIGQVVSIIVTHQTKKSVNGSLSQARDDRAVESKKLIDAVSAERFQAGEVSAAETAAAVAKADKRCEECPERTKAQETT